MDRDQSLSELFVEGLRNVVPGGRWHEVKIEKVTNGFIVKIGCKTFVATSWPELSKKLGEYWADPKAAEKKYAK